jgi:starvation-inducible DNA-binding protein
MAVKPHIPLASDQHPVAVLQGMLVDLLDLTLIGKHAHWNVVGRHFRSVHHELDELKAWQPLADDVAERAATIGASPGGQAETIVGATRLPHWGVGSRCTNAA